MYRERKSFSSNIRRASESHKDHLLRRVFFVYIKTKKAGWFVSFSFYIDFSNAINMHAGNRRKIIKKTTIPLRIHFTETWYLCLLQYENIVSINLLPFFQIHLVWILTCVMNRSMNLIPERKPFRNWSIFSNLFNCIIK